MLFIPYDEIQRSTAVLSGELLPSFGRWVHVDSFCDAYMGTDRPQHMDPGIGANQNTGYVQHLVIFPMGLN